MKSISIGIDLGGTRIKTVLLDENENILSEDIIATHDNGENTNNWKSFIPEYIEKIKKDYGNSISYCGIAAPGLVNKDNKSIGFMPGRLDGLENLDWQSVLGIPVKVLNDGHAACIAEWQQGAGQGFGNVLMLTLGTGVGGAAILNGQLYQGTVNRAGHFGHICLDHHGAPSYTNMVGSLEHAIGNKYVNERTFGNFSDNKSLVHAYSKGDAIAAYWWLDSVNKLACGLCSLINAFSPEIIIIGGGTIEAGDKLFGPLERFMEVYEWRPGKYKTLIKSAELGVYAGAIGAALFSKYGSCLTTRITSHSNFEETRGIHKDKDMEVK